MNWFKVLPVIAAFLLIACAHFNPTPNLFNELIEENNQVVASYAACSEGANYVPTKEGCDPETLASQARSTMDLAKDFISGDIKQPQGYDIHLAIAMIYFRIAERNGDEYSEVERIARQFFEVQKASSGQSIDAARFYWVVMAAAHASWQFYNDPEALNQDRKTDLVLCLEQGQLALEGEALAMFRQVLLAAYMEALITVVSMI